MASLTFQVAPWTEPDEILMALVLTYRGQLVACSKDNRRASEKQRMRWLLSKQLDRHWNHDQYLKIEALRPGKIDKGRYLRPADESGRGRRLFAEFCGVEYVPLITTELCLFCDLEIDWLRPEHPGGIIQGADLDAALKTLFDALRMPHDEYEACEVEHGDMKRCYCLLEDDSLIRNLKIESNKLLDEAKTKNDVELRIKATMVSAGWEGYLSL